MPTPLRNEMFLTSQAQRSPEFRLQRFLNQYFLNEYALEAIGYEKTSVFATAEEGFDGFMACDNCYLNKSSREKGNIIVTCMIPPARRVSFGEYIAEEKVRYTVDFWKRKNHVSLGGGLFNPDVMLMAVTNFPTLSYVDSQRGVVTERVTRQWNAIGANAEDRYPDPNAVESRSRRVCYPVMIRAGLEYFYG